MTAQTQVVIPARYAKSEAESFTGFPFSRTTAVRAQHWYAPSHFARKGSITAVAFRPDGGKDFASKGIEVEVFLATGPKLQGALRSTFARNRGSDFRSVFKRRRLNLPKIRASDPRSFSTLFRLDSAFAYDPARGGLLVEVVVYSQQPGRFELDLGTECTSPRASFGKPGCKGSNGKVPVADSPTKALLWGKSFVVRVRDLRAHGPVILAVGTRESGTWMGLQLPYSMAAIGAPGCTLNTDIVHAEAAAATASGEARKVGMLPPLPSLAGHWFRFQALALDSAANALGITTSNGAKIQICGPDPVSRVLATSVALTDGQIDPGAVPVTRIEMR